MNGGRGGIRGAVSAEILGTGVKKIRKRESGGNRERRIRGGESIHHGESDALNGCKSHSTESSNGSADDTRGTMGSMCK